MSIRVILADDHRIVREGLRLVLEGDKDIHVVAEANDGREAVELSRKLSPDVVVMDIAMPELNGVEATRQIVKGSSVKVVGLSTYADRRYVLAMMEAGASGYVLKTNAGEELLRAVHAAYRGGKFLSPDVAGAVVDKAFGPSTPATTVALAPREREVVQLLAEGKTSKDIASLLGITVNTVEAHRRNIMEKLHLHSVAELTKYALREGLTQL